MLKTPRNKEIIIAMRRMKRPDIQRMDEDDVIIVNRIRLNSKLVEYEIRKTDYSCVAIISDAIKSMDKEERKQNKYVSGVKMRVGDVKKIFPDYKELPLNSFALAND